jgi:hypothetical protein
LNIKISPKPVVKFDEQVYILPIGKPIKFKDSTINAINWLWKFGDGATSTLQNPTHTYVLMGSYLIKKIVTTPAGCIDSAEAIAITRFISDTSTGTGKQNRIIKKSTYIPTRPQAWYLLTFNHNQI